MVALVKSVKKLPNNVDYILLKLLKFKNFKIFIIYLFIIIKYSDYRILRQWGVWLATKVTNSDGHWSEYVNCLFLKTLFGFYLVKNKSN